MESMIVGISGYARHGKDTFGRHLRAHLQEMGIGVSDHSFAAPIYEAISVMTGISVSDLHWYKERNLHLPGYGVTVRHLAQTLGTEWARGHNHRWWLIRMQVSIEQARQRWSAAGSKTLVQTITDVRFPNEAEAIRKEWGGLLLRIHRDGFDNGIGTSHPSEKHIPELPVNEVLQNNHPDAPQRLAGQWAKQIAQRLSEAGLGAKA